MASQGTFGLSSSRGGAVDTVVRGSFRGSFRGNRGRGRGRGGRAGRGSTGKSEAAPVREDDGTQLAERFERVVLNDEVDEKLGFARVDQGPETRRVVD
jgi:DNA polymerase epsilon subunit 1